MKVEKTWWDKNDLTINEENCEKIKILSGIWDISNTSYPINDRSAYFCPFLTSPKQKSPFPANPEVAFWGKIPIPKIPKSPGLSDMGFEIPEKSHPKATSAQKPLSD